MKGLFRFIIGLLAIIIFIALVGDAVSLFGIIGFILTVVFIYFMSFVIEGMIIGMKLEKEQEKQNAMRKERSKNYGEK